MPRCPNCNYTLVLLEHRRKYKCPRCSRLYSQKEIEVQDFVQYNKMERQKDKEALTENKGKQKPLTDFEKKQNRLISRKNWRNNHPDYNSEKCKEYYYRNKEKILAKQKEYRKKSGQVIKARLERLKIENLEKLKSKGRINYWRMRQKELAQLYFEFEDIKDYKDEFREVLPTLALSYLLVL